MRKKVEDVMWKGFILVLLLYTAFAEEDGYEDEPEYVDEIDDAPFVVVLLREDETRCSGAMVSPLMAVTSRRCASHHLSPNSSLWALEALHATDLADSKYARRVVRISYPIDKQSDIGVEGWAGARYDFALVEIETALPTAKLILMATQDNDCKVSQLCHTIKVDIPSTGRVRLRVLDVVTGDDATCAARAPNWQALDDRALCYTGTQLCDTERGAGIFSEEGKLCGVVSESLVSTPPGANDEGHCGDTHAAQAMTRWTKFLHCALTLRTCNGECADICKEVRLRGSTSKAKVMTPRAPSRLPSDQPKSELEPGSTNTEGISASVTMSMTLTMEMRPKGTRRSQKPWISHPFDSVTFARRTNLTQSSVTSSLVNASTPSLTRTIVQHPTFSITQKIPTRSASCHFIVGNNQFEPNRADFRAGEYGDNAADYDYGPVASMCVTGELTSPSTVSPPPTSSPGTKTPSPSLKLSARRHLQNKVAQNKSHMFSIMIVLFYVLTNINILKG